MQVILFALLTLPAVTGLQTSLAARTASHPVVLRASPPQMEVMDRRAMVSLFTSAAVASAALSPRTAFALDPEKDRPNESLLLILRVKEAAAQEIRLVKSGKFKDLQRASIKLAVNLMLTNYQLLENINTASVLARGKSFEAQQIGIGAVESLQAVLEYFDSGGNSLKVDSISSEKLAFVVRALETTRSRIDQFLEYMPEYEVAKCKAFIDYENQQNLQEYADFNNGERYLNPKPS